MTGLHDDDETIDRRLLRSLAGLGTARLPGEVGDDALLTSALEAAPAIAATASTGWALKLVLAIAAVCGTGAGVAVVAEARAQPAEVATRMLPRLEPVAETAAPLPIVAVVDAPETRPEIAVVETVVAPVRARAASGGDPERLLARAQKAYADGRVAPALADYHALLARFPRSPQARAARVSLGRIELARGRAATALRHFDAYLAAGAGALAEEAEYGRVIALRRLGRKADERRAIDGFLAAHPQGIHAAALRERAAVLGQ